MIRGWKTVLTGLGVALGLAASGAAASAGFNTTFGGASPSSAVSYSARGATASGQVAGQMDWTTTGPINAALANLNGQTGNNFVTFCIEVTQNVSTGNVYTFDAQNLTTLPTSGTGQPMSATKANDLAQFWKQWQSVITQLTTAPGNITINSNSYSRNVVAAALQVAIWEIVYEKSGTENANGSGYNVYGENGGTNQGFRLTANATAGTLADYLLDNTNFAAGAEANLVGFKLTRNGNPAQDQITVENNGFDGLEPTPAPPAVILALAGILPCLALRRRLRSQAA